MDLYFARHDNQAVTIDDFVQAMQDASGVDLTRFRRWYHQAGTPEVTVSDGYDAGARRYTLTLTQRTPPTPGQPDKQPLVIPVAMGLLRRRPAAKSPTRTLLFGETEQSFVFDDVPERAGAVAAARLLRAGEAVRRAACATAVPGRARHRSVRALGVRAAIRDASAAGDGGGVAARRDTGARSRA